MLLAGSWPEAYLMQLMAVHSINTKQTLDIPFPCMVYDAWTGQMWRSVACVKKNKMIFNLANLYLRSTWLIAAEYQYLWQVTVIIFAVIFKILIKKYILHIQSAFVSHPCSFQTDFLLENSTHFLTVKVTDCYIPPTSIVLWIY